MIDIIKNNFAQFTLGQHSKNVRSFRRFNFVKTTSRFHLSTIRCSEVKFQLQKIVEIEQEIWETEVVLEQENKVTEVRSRTILEVNNMLALIPWPLTFPSLDSISPLAGIKTDRFSEQVEIIMPEVMVEVEMEKNKKVSVEILKTIASLKSKNERQPIINRPTNNGKL